MLINIKLHCIDALHYNNKHFVILFKASRIEEMTFVYFHLTFGLQSAIVVVGYVLGVIVDGYFRIMVF